MRAAVAIVLIASAVWRGAAALPGSASTWEGVGCAMQRDYASEPGRPAFSHPSRVLTGYMSESKWAIMEFKYMAHSSWVRHFQGYPSRFDIVIAGAPAMAAHARPLCHVVLPGTDPNRLRVPGRMQECFFFPYPDRSQEHYGFFGINQAAFLLDETIGNWLSQYDLVIKSDFDVFLLPALVDYFPPPGKVVFGRQFFVLMPETAMIMQNVTKGMGYRTRKDWQINIGMTSYGTLEDLQGIARHMIPTIKYILENTFEQKKGGGPELDFGKGWPKWSVYIAAMYAQEIAANHYLGEFIVDNRLDAHSDKEVPTESLVHVHCQHGAERFHKREFFRYQYADVELASLDPLTANDCVTWLALSAWREFLKTQPPGTAERYRYPDEL